MTTYDFWNQTLPVGATETNDGPVTSDLGLQFAYSSSNGHQLAGYRFWLPADGSTAGANYTFRLWSTTTGNSGTVVTGSTVTGSGALTAGAWNTILLSSPVALVTGTTYVASVSMAGNPVAYDFVHFFWSSGAGAAGVTSGPLTAPSAASALGGQQQTFNQPSTGGFPSSAFDSSWYSFDVVVQTVVAVTTTSLPNGAVGSPYSATLTASGGTAPYTWSITAGALPAWASLNASTGVISGTPNASGVSTFTVKVTDNAGNTDTKPLSITVPAPAPGGTGLLTAAFP